MSKPLEIISDKRFKDGNIKQTGRELRGNPETMKMERMKVPAGLLDLNPPIVVSKALAKKIKEQL